METEKGARAIHDLGAPLRSSLEEAGGPWAAELAAAGEAAVRGGAAALRFYGRAELAVRDKGDDDPVTAADHGSNDEILRFLTGRFPDDPIRSEESRRSRHGTAGAGGTDQPGRLWIVDPLDGTKEFLARNGEFSVMVGFAHRGAAVLGAVYRPEPDVLYLGTASGGAWRVADAQQDPAVHRLEIGGEAGRPLRFVQSRSHPDERLERLRAALGPVQVVRSGSVGIKCALIAAGSVDLYVHPVPHLKEWDTCAPEAILRGAGGRVTDCAGEPLRYGKTDPRQPRGIFAARADVWPRVAPAVREVAADMLRDSTDEEG